MRSGSHSSLAGHTRWAHASLGCHHEIGHRVITLRKFSLLVRGRKDGEHSGRAARRPDPVPCALQPAGLPMLSTMCADPGPDGRTGLPPAWGRHLPGPGPDLGQAGPADSACQRCPAGRSPQRERAAGAGRLWPGAGWVRGRSALVGHGQGRGHACSAAPAGARLLCSCTLLGCGVYGGRARGKLCRALHNSSALCGDSTTSSTSPCAINQLDPLDHTLPFAVGFPWPRRHGGWRLEQA